MCAQIYINRTCWVYFCCLCVYGFKTNHSALGKQEGSSLGSPRIYTSDRKLLCETVFDFTCNPFQKPKYSRSACVKLVAFVHHILALENASWCPLWHAALSGCCSSLKTFSVADDAWHREDPNNWRLSLPHWTLKVICKVGVIPKGCGSRQNSHLQSTYCSVISFSVW